MKDSAEEHLLIQKGIPTIQPFVRYRIYVNEHRLSQKDDQNNIKRSPWRHVLKKVIQILATTLTFVIGVSLVVFVSRLINQPRLCAPGGLVVGMLMLIVYLSFE